MGATEHRTVAGLCTGLPSPHDDIRAQSTASLGRSTNSRGTPPYLARRTAAAHEPIPRRRQDHWKLQLQHARDVFYVYYAHRSPSLHVLRRLRAGISGAGERVAKRKSRRGENNRRGMASRRSTKVQTSNPSVDPATWRSGPAYNSPSSRGCMRAAMTRTRGTSALLLPALTQAFTPRAARVGTGGVDRPHTADPATRRGGGGRAAAPPALARGHVRDWRTRVRRLRAPTMTGTRGVRSVCLRLSSRRPAHAAHSTRRDEDTIPNGTPRARGGAASQGMPWSSARGPYPHRAAGARSSPLPQYRVRRLEEERRGEVSLQAARAPPSAPRLSPAAHRASDPARDDHDDDTRVWHSPCHPPPARAHGPPDREPVARARLETGRGGVGRRHEYDDARRGTRWAGRRAYDREPAAGARLKTRRAACSAARPPARAHSPTDRAPSPPDRESAARARAKTRRGGVTRRHATTTRVRRRLARGARARPRTQPLPTAHTALPTARPPRGHDWRRSLGGVGRRPGDAGRRHAYEDARLGTRARQRTTAETACESAARPPAHTALPTARALPAHDRRRRSGGVGRDLATQDEDTRTTTHGAGRAHEGRVDGYVIPLPPPWLSLTQLVWCCPCFRRRGGVRSDTGLAGWLRPQAGRRRSPDADFKRRSSSRLAPVRVQLTAYAPPPGSRRACISPPARQPPFDGVAPSVGCGCG
ncbi:hypothetical protein FB451DRAFT_1408864 [Mycena latifolia]|nr:hypothetical protein FB451DRAFT_1408864 [Mycena latifolia]